VLRFAAALIGLAVATSASAQDRVLGVLTLPEVFGTKVCEKFTPEEVLLYSDRNGGQPLGAIRVDRPWEFPAIGGCVGLVVNTRISGEIVTLDTGSTGTHASGVLVTERHQQWYKIRAGARGVWLHASPRDEFHSLERLFSRALTYFTTEWTGRLVDAPGSSQVVASRAPDSEPPVEVLGLQESGGQLWARVALLSHTICESNEEPRVLAEGWAPVHSATGQLVIWFYSAGC
jgi:hypothetical protein